MRRTGYLGISLLLVLALAATALPGFSQAAPAAQAKQPQAKTQAEYNAYTALYNEKNPQKKAELGEKFLMDFKETDFVPQTYTMIIGAYTGHIRAGHSEVRMAEVQRLEPLSSVTVVARVVNGRSTYLANPILELVELP